MSIKTIPIHNYITDNGYITVYQDQKILDEAKNEFIGECQVIDLQKHWDGQIYVNVKLSELPSPFLTKDDCNILGVPTDCTPFDIGTFFSVFSGDAYVKNIKKGLPVIIEFQGSGMLKRDGKELI